MKINLYAETSARLYSYYAELELPATQAEIRDAMQRARMEGDARILSFTIEVVRCDEIPELPEVGLDKPTIDEMNYLAKRLKQLSSDDQYLLNAVISGRHDRGQYKDGIPMKELINLTYGLDHFTIIDEIEDVQQLGRYVIENGMLSTIANVPKEAYSLLNTRTVGKMWQEKDGGVFWYHRYIQNGSRNPPEIYDGVHLPEEAVQQEPDYVFRLEIARAPDEDEEVPEDQRMWISLPIDEDEANKIVQDHFDVESIEDCIYYGFESSIPQIDSEGFFSMGCFDLLNYIAQWYQAASDFEQAKYKAVLEGNKIKSVVGAMTAIRDLNRYDFSCYCNSHDDYYREYLLRHLDRSVDPRWLRDIEMPKNASRMVDRVGATFTNYGIISKRDISLFEPLSYDEPESTQQQDKGEDTQTNPDCSTNAGSPTLTM